MVCWRRAVVLARGGRVMTLDRHTRTFMDYRILDGWLVTLLLSCRFRDGGGVGLIL